MIARMLLAMPLAVGGICLTTAACADMLPPPGAVERAYVGMIIDAGFQCAGEASFVAANPAVQEKYERQGLQARIVACGDGHKYLVATPPRHHGPPIPNEPPPSKPVIEPLP